MVPFHKRVAIALIIALAALFASSPADAGIGDKLKKKVSDKVGQKADQKTDDALNKADKEKAETGEEPGSEGGNGAPAEEVSQVSTKFDFIPGDKVLLFDDFSTDELGEFPHNFKLSAGTVETAEMKGERWLRLASEFGRVRPKVEGLAKMPEFWTLEFDIHASKPLTGSFQVHGKAAEYDAWIASFQDETATFQSGATTASTEFEASDISGRHHVMVLGRGKALKVYIDTQRVVNIPEYDTQWGEVTELEIRMNGPDSKPMITNVRFAEGPKPPKDLFETGTFVTYGIYFDSNSDVVKPESAPVLRQIASYLEKNPAVKVQIVGHTDGQGTADGNLDLSKRRAASVASVLAGQFKFAPERFATDGMGQTKPVSPNDTAEGRAMNRRVEFTKVTG